MRKTIIGSVLLVLAVVGAIAGIGYRKYKVMTAPQPAYQETPDAVLFATTEPITVRNISSAIGTVLAPRSIQLKTELVGTVSEVNFKPGDIVKQGQLLLKLDTTVEEAQLNSAKAAQKIASSTFARTELASKSRALSDLELEQSAAQLAQATAEVARIEAVIRKKTLQAPFDARAGLFDIHVGQYIPEGTQITTLQGIAPYVHIDFTMPQQVADEIKVGDCVRLVTNTSNNTPTTTATIIAIDSQADRISRSIMARARLDSPPSSMQPNDSIRVEIDYGTAKTVVKTPAAALRSSPTGAFVYVVLPDEKDPSKQRAITQPVIPGRNLGQDVVILSGLQPGQLIVADGSFKVHHGSWVMNMSNATATTAAN